ncbi:MAG: TolC family protein [Pseudomonadota bacterium]
MNTTVRTFRWRKHLRLLALFCAALLLGQAAHAAENLTLEDAITATITRNPDLQAFGYALRAQDGRILQASLAPKPELNVAIEDVLGTGVARGLSGSQTTVSIAWVVEGDLRQRRIDAARMGSLTLVAEAQVMRLDAAAQTARLYTHALADQLRRDMADSAVQLATENIAAIQQRVTTGIAMTSELAQAEAALAKRVLYREDFEHELTADYHRLAAQWGDLTPQFERVEGDPLRLPVVEPYETLVTRIEQNPDLSHFLSETRLQESLLQLEQAQSNSLWRFNAGLRRLQSSSDTGFVAGVSIPLNRGNLNQGRIAEVRATLEQTDAMAAATRIRIQTSLLVIYLELQHNIHRAETLRDEVIPRFEAALAEIHRAYDLGSASYLERLQVQEELLDARSELAETSVQAHLKLIEIERLTGARLAQLPVAP